MVPRDEISVNDRDLKLSNQRYYLSSGANPLPIYAAVRHEIPLEEQKTEEKKVKGKTTDAAKEKAKQEAWFQWFEFTPYELFCEEFEAGIPSWSIGRHFQMGRSVTRDNRPPLPELRIPFLMGIWGSAFCATVRNSQGSISSALTYVPRIFKTLDPSSIASANSKISISLLIITKRSARS